MCYTGPEVSTQRLQLIRVNEEFEGELNPQELEQVAAYRRTGARGFHHRGAAEWQKYAAEQAGKAIWCMRKFSVARGIFTCLIIFGTNASADCSKVDSLHCDTSSTIGPPKDFLNFFMRRGSHIGLKKKLPSGFEQRRWRKQHINILHVTHRSNCKTHQLGQAENEIVIDQCIHTMYTM